ncbi:MAG: hypothetical protein C6I01_00900 [Epsilonproteobacteria bacterium]|nr:hypothetical protein [Campylobacterota bacterium]
MGRAVEEGYPNVVTQSETDIQNLQMGGVVVSIFKLPPLESGEKMFVVAFGNSPLPGVVALVINRMAGGKRAIGGGGQLQF